MKNQTRLSMRLLAALLASAALIPAAAIAAQTELRVGAASADIGNLDPHFASSTSDRTLVAWIYGGLVRFAPGSTDPSSIEGDLAESWEASSDNLVWTFKLHPGVQWQHGYGEVTADDVVFSLQKSADPKRSAFATDYKAIKSVEAVDPHTVRITLANPVPSLLGLLTNYSGGFIISKKAYEERGEGFTRNPVGFGPFQFESVDRRGCEQVSPKDYCGAPRSRGNLCFLNAAAGETSPSRQEIDVAAGTTDRAGTANERCGRQDRYLRSARRQIIHLNRNQKPFDDIRVRGPLPDNPGEIAQFHEPILRVWPNPLSLRTTLA